MTDTHAQLLPVYFREPSVNLGIGAMAGKPPHLVGRAFLDRFGIAPDSAEAYAFTFLDFEKSAARFGKLGGFAHLKTLIDRLRSDCFSTASASRLTAPRPMPSLFSISKNPPRGSASSAASRI